MSATPNDPTTPDPSDAPLADETPLEEELTLDEPAEPAMPAEPVARTWEDELEPAGVLVDEPTEVEYLAAPEPRTELAGAAGIELFGTFVLVLAGVGVGMYASALGIGALGTALAFGLALLALIAAFGRVSGGHFNPAVTLGAALAGRTPWSFVLPYWIAQVVGGALATTVLFVVAKSNPGLTAEVTQSFFAAASNTFGAESPAGFGLVGALVLETIVTGVFVAIILGSTARDAQPGLAAPAIGLTLAFGLLILTPVTNGSMNPARSLASALFAGSAPLGQVWLFWVAPLLGAAIAGLLYALFRPADDDALPLLELDDAPTPYARVEG